jgi:anti-sigma factor RsiW
MTERERSDALSDAALTGYLDGELSDDERARIEDALRRDPLARDRLAALQHGGQVIRGALDTMLDAVPEDRLTTMLSSAVAQSHRPVAVPTRAPVSRIVLALAACLLLVIGGAIGFLAGQAGERGALPASERWLQAVAQQVSLYGPASLADVSLTPTDAQRRLATLSASLDLSLQPGAVALPGLTLRRVDLLQIAGRPLGQLLYDGSTTGPVALCITAEPGESDAAQVSRSIAGMNLVYWNSGGHGFVLVGAAPAAKIEQLSQIVISRFRG